MYDEWTETSYLEPDNLYGYGYLEAVKKVFVEEAAAAESELAVAVAGYREY